MHLLDVKFLENRDGIFYIFYLLTCIYIVLTMVLHGNTWQNILKGLWNKNKAAPKITLWSLGSVRGSSSLLTTY